MLLKIMSFNLKNNRISRDSALHWTKRAPIICKLIEEENPDIIGTQECSKEMLAYLKKELFNYQLIENSKTQYEDDNLILIKKDKFEILKKKVFYLSTTPEIINSKNTFSIQPRKCSFLKIKYQNKIIEFYNTHLDFLFYKVKVNQLNHLKQLLKKEHKELNSIILVGDFNMPYNKEIKKLEQEILVKDICKNIGTTFHLRKNKEAIDHILVNQNTEILQIKKFNNNYDKVPPSDHYAILTIIKLQ